MSLWTWLFSSKAATSTPVTQAAVAGVRGGELHTIINADPPVHNQRNEERIKTLNHAVQNVTIRVQKGRLDKTAGHKLIAGYNKELRRRLAIKELAEL